MADNQTISNNYASTEPNFRAKSKQMSDGAQLQYVALDISDNTTPSPVTASNPLPVTASFAPPSSATATLSNVAASASNVTILAANGSRKTVILFNDSTAALYLKFGATINSLPPAL